MVQYRGVFFSFLSFRVCSRLSRSLATRISRIAVTPMSQKSCQATPDASNSSLLSPSSSLSQDDDNALARPFKKIKTQLSNCSTSSTIIDLDNPDQDASTVASDAPDIEVVEVDPEKDLGTFVDYFQTALEFMNHDTRYRGFEKGLALTNIQLLQVRWGLDSIS
jgi:hypothetical protein